MVEIDTVPSMKDFQLNLAVARSWFQKAQDTPYVVVRVDPEHAKAWGEALGLAVRRCYIADALLMQSASVHGVPEIEIIASKLPDPGATMAGDFGEILVCVYQASEEATNEPIGTLKWRLKQDRKKPAPFSDVVQFVLPSWPTPTADDVVLCAEVKAKSTKSKFEPIKTAIEGCEKDRTSRLADTLVWLRERALTQDLGELKIDHLARFINAVDYPAAKRRFRAVAVVSADILSDELKGAPTSSSADYTVVVIAVPDLKATYSSVFDAARNAVAVAENATAAQQQ
jgi:hypothetical protein